MPINEIMKKRPYTLLVFDLQGTLAEDGRFIEGVPDLLKQLKQRDYLIAAATNWGAASLNHLLEDLPAYFTFDAVRHAGNHSSKPDPQMMLEILDELNVQPNETLMIGDTTADMEFAQNAGTDALAVSYSGTPAKYLLTYTPVSCVNSIQALKAWFYL